MKHIKLFEWYSGYVVNSNYMQFQEQLDFTLTIFKSEHNHGKYLWAIKNMLINLTEQLPKYSIDDLKEIFKIQIRQSQINIDSANNLYGYIKMYYPQFVIRMLTYNNNKEFDILIECLEYALNIKSSLINNFKLKSEEYYISPEAHEAFEAEVFKAIEEDSVYVFCETNFKALKKSFDYIDDSYQMRIMHEYHNLVKYVLDTFSYINKDYYYRTMKFSHIDGQVHFQPKQPVASEGFGILKDIDMRYEGDFDIVINLIELIKQRESTYTIANYISKNISYIKYNISCSYWYYICQLNDVNKSDLYILRLCGGEAVSHLVGSKII